MAWSAQWRTQGEQIDAVFVLDDKGTVREAFPATQPLLSRLLTQMGNLETWKGEASVAGDNHDPEAWGQLVLARAGSGEVMEVEPELFWHGIYLWFRSHGVDYDTPGLDGSSLVRDVVRPPRSSLMDD